MSARARFCKARIAPPAGKTPPRHELAFLEKGVFEKLARHPALQMVTAMGRDAHEQLARAQTQSLMTTSLKLTFFGVRRHGPQVQK
jgi:hypothetical protein